MAEHPVALVTNEGTFRGLAKQNILFHQCISELIDNAIAATPPTRKFQVDIIFDSGLVAEEIVDLYFVDNGHGMTVEHLSRALQLGESATTESRLNEHGFGLKNSLATLSGTNGYWKIWTKAENSSSVCTVEGPFKPNMVIKDGESLPQFDFLPADYSTLIHVPVKRSFIQTVQGRGAPSKDLSNLRLWLIEHLGVLYRGYLDLDADTDEHSGVIIVSIGRDSLRVPTIRVPLSSMSTSHFQIEIGGKVIPLEYRYGTLDEPKRDKLVKGQKAKFYYQGNQPTQGIDIRLGKRVIATRQFETIWKTDKGDSQLAKHPSFNDFVGELLIPELPRGLLTTVNNKTDFNLDDQNWVNIFNKLNEIRPPKQIRQKTEKDLKERWITMLKATNSEDMVSDERHVWPTGVRIDVYREKPDGQIIIYELKVGTGSPEHLYQLKMYWDGLVIEGKYPREAILFCESFGTTLQEMANVMNTLAPPVGSKPYNFNIEKLKDKGL